jgi:hypothetical protein
LYLSSPIFYILSSVFCILIQHSYFRTMVAALNSYLVQHKRLSIPGLGTIYVERVPAQTDFVNKQIIPPAYHYRFDRYFDAPDKDFFTYLAAQREIADYEAIRWYNEWAYDLRNKLRTQEEVKWENVGTLRTDVSGEVIFEPQQDLVSFLDPVPAERVIRSNAQHTMLVGDREVTNTDMTDYLNEEPVYVEKESWWIYALILATVAALVIFFHFFQNGVNRESVINQQTIRTQK